MSEEELTRLTTDLVLDQRPQPTTPYAARVLERLRRDIAALPREAIIEIPSGFV